jgi:predicted outer membrane protein
LKHATRVSLVVASCMAAVAGAWAAGNAAPSRNAAPAASPAAAASPAPAKLNSSDSSYLADAMSVNQAEIDASNYAVKHASTPKVRQFAQAIAHDDTQTLADMQKANDGTIPAPVPDTQADRFFTDKTGTDVDKAYLDLMIGSMDVAVGKCQAAADLPIYGPAVRAIARKTEPTIRRHDATANSLEQSLPAKEN